MRELQKECCIQYDRLELLVQWHPDKNGDLTPDETNGGGRGKLCRCCDRGHE